MRLFTEFDHKNPDCWLVNFLLPCFHRYSVTNCVTGVSYVVPCVSLIFPTDVQNKISVHVTYLKRGKNVENVEVLGEI